LKARASSIANSHSIQDAWLLVEPMP
jgi:hypothetical protein